MTINKKGNSFDWKKFFVKTKKLIQFASSTTISPVSADRWEEIVFHVLKSMGEKYKGGEPKWEIGSHSIGADVWTDRIAISIKSGRVEKDFLIFSSYRLTKFDDIEQIKDFIDGPAKNFDIYLFCTRDKNSKGDINYGIYMAPANIVNAKELEWVEKLSIKKRVFSGWETKSKNGIILDIRKNMSNQLWLKLPIELCTKIGEINIPFNLLGSSLAKVVNE